MAKKGGNIGKEEKRRIGLLLLIKYLLGKISRAKLEEGLDELLQN